MQIEQDNGIPAFTAALLKIGRRMPRERRQNGWVEKTGKTVKTWTGYWYEYVLVDGVEKRRGRCKVLGRCSELTKGAAQELLLQVIRNWRPAAVGATFEEIASWYLKTNSGRWSKSWNTSVSSIFKHHVLPHLGNFRAADLKRSDIQQAMNAIATAENSQSESMVKKCLTQIRAVFEFAIEDDLLEKNPARKVVMPPCRSAAGGFLSLEDCQRLLDVSPPQERLILRLFILCGLRPSELFALRVSDLGNGALKIDETIVRGELTGRTKTKDSRASVPLSAELESELRFYALEEGLESDDFLFPSATGTAIGPENFLDRVLQPLGRLAGIEHLTHQMLRRTTATHFQKHGTVKDAQALLRHSSHNTTLTYYQKVLEASLVAGVQSWDETLMAGVQVRGPEPGSPGSSQPA